MKVVDREQVLKGIDRANPWWKGVWTSNFSSLPKRIHFDRLLHLTKQKDPNRALVILGPRRVGKTVLIYQIINELIESQTNPKKIMYLSLDNPIFRFKSLDELLEIGMAWSGTSMEDAVIFFDEIQYLNTWEQQLKVLVDTHRNTKFVVTGSAAAALHKKSKESGAGRFTNYLLPSLSFYEYIFIKQFIEKYEPNTIDLIKLNSHYIDYLNFGSFPESISSPTIRSQPELYIGQDILDKVLGRDLPNIFGITNPSELQSLFTALVYNTSNEISLENLSKHSGVKKDLISKYIGFFEAAFLIRVIEKTDNHLKKFKRKTMFKIILTNPSLRSAIFGKLNPEDQELEGLAETAIYSQLLVPENTFFPYKYARWNIGGSSGEVDLVHVTQDNQALSVLEIKWTDRYAKEIQKPNSLISFCKNNDLKQAIMSTKSLFNTTKNDDLIISHYPTSILCFVLGMLGGVYDTAIFYTNPDFKSESYKLNDDKNLLHQMIKNIKAIELLDKNLKDRLPEVISSAIKLLYKKSVK